MPRKKALFHIFFRGIPSITSPFSLPVRYGILFLLPPPIWQQGGGLWNVHHDLSDERGCWSRILCHLVRHTEMVGTVSGNVFQPVQSKIPAMCRRGDFVAVDHQYLSDCLQYITSDLSCPPSRPKNSFFCDFMVKYMICFFPLQPPSQRGDGPRERRGESPVRKDKRHAASSAGAISIHEVRLWILVKAKSCR